MKLTARAIVYGDDISTDLIIAGKYTKTMDIQNLGDHAMEDLDPDFKSKCRQGAFLVAGEYFGCGSSREQAPVALKEAGIRCIIAKSFSRIFYRNAINIGLPLIECDTSDIKDADILTYVIGGELVNETTGKAIPVKPLPDLMAKILNHGGAVSFVKEFGGFDHLAYSGSSEGNE